MTNSLESKIQELVSGIAAQIAQAVKTEIATQVAQAGHTGAATGSTKAAAKKAPVAKAAPAPQPAPKAKGKPGPKPKAQPAPKAVASKPAAPAAPAPSVHGEEARVLDAIRSNPGVRAERISGLVNLSGEETKKILKKLRASGAVRTEGEKRGTSYHAAGPAPAPAPAPRRPGRPKGSKNKTAAAAKVVAAAAAAANGKRPRSDRSYSDADLNRVLSVIQAKPGLRPSQYQSESKLKSNVFDRLIANLKQSQRIQVVGAGRNTTYVVVG